MSELRQSVAKALGDYRDIATDLMKRGFRFDGVQIDDGNVMLHFAASEIKFRLTYDLLSKLDYMDVSAALVFYADTPATLVRLTLSLPLKVGKNE